MAKMAKMAKMEKMVCIATCDGHRFEIPLERARESLTLRGMLDMLEEELGEDDLVVPLAGVCSGAVLERLFSLSSAAPAAVAQAAPAHAADSDDENDENDENGQNVWRSASQRRAPTTGLEALATGEVKEMLSAAHFLDHARGMELAAQELAARLEGKTPAEMREILGLEDDFTEEERREVEQETAWALPELSSKQTKEAAV